MNLQIINPLAYPDWDDLLLTAENATFFHTSAWARVLSESYGYKPLYFSAVDNGGLTGLLPVMEVVSLLTGKRGGALPFTDMSEPLATSEDTFKALLQAAVEYGRQAGWKHLEIRGGRGFLLNEPHSEEYIIHKLELASDESGVNRNFKPNIRRNIRKAEKEGLTVHFERSLEALTAFYKLHCGTRRRHGLPPQPWSFFRKIHEHVVAVGKGVVALARYKNQWVAGAVYALFRDQAVYKYGASDGRLQHLRPNDLVMWEAILWLAREKFLSLHLGRTETTNNGLLRFKRGWGAAEGKLAYYRFDMRKKKFVSTNSMPKSSYRVFNLMPVPMLQMAGRMLYRHMG